MNIRTDKTRVIESRAAASHAVSRKERGGERLFPFVDNRPGAIARRKLPEMANRSPQVRQLRSVQEIANSRPQATLEKERHILMSARALTGPSIEANHRTGDRSGVNSLVQRKGVVQRGGAAVAENAEENIQSTGRGIQGIQGLINALTPADENPACSVGVMVRYPTWGNYLKAKGGHAAIQIKVEFGDERGTKYIQAGVSATGSIQVEPIFHTTKTREGYNIKRLEKTVDKGTCINVLKGVAKEIAIDQPYQERIVVNTGGKTNCSLWAAKMAAIAGMDLSTMKMWVFPSPNDLQHALDYYRQTEGHTLTDSKELQEEAQEINVNVGTVPGPQVDEDGGIIFNNLSEDEVNALNQWATELD